MQNPAGTVKEIAALLAQGNVRDDALELLANDPRASIKKLLAGYRRRQMNLRQETERVQRLYRNERRLAGGGYARVAGVDEAGRGPLAGPVVIGAVILPLGAHIPRLNDSKKLSPAQREAVYEDIRRTAIAWRYAVVEAAVIDRINIYQATVRGMYQAVGALCPAPDAVLTDAVPLPALAAPHEAIVRGDAVSASIAAASVVAKVERDRIMEKLDGIYPQYAFSRHKGYGTKEHLAAIEKYGPCPQHRLSFAPLKSGR